MDSEEKSKPTNVNNEPSSSETSEVWNPPYGVLMLKLSFDNKGLSKTELCFVTSELPKNQDGKRVFNVFKVASADRNHKNESFVASQVFPDSILSKELVGRIPFGSHYEYKLPANDKELHEFIGYLSDHLRAKLRLNITEGKEPGLKVLVKAEKDRLIATIDKVTEELLASRRNYGRNGYRSY